METIEFVINAVIMGGKLILIMLNAIKNDIVWLYYEFPGMVYYSLRCYVYKPWYYTYYINKAWYRHIKLFRSNRFYRRRWRRRSRRWFRIKVLFMYSSCIVGFIIAWIYTQGIINFERKNYLNSYFRLNLRRSFNTFRMRYSIFMLKQFSKNGFFYNLNKGQFFIYYYCKLLKKANKYLKNLKLSTKYKRREMRAWRPQSYWRQKLFERNQPGVDKFNEWLKEVQDTPEYKKHMEIVMKQQDEMLALKSKKESDYYENRKKNIWAQNFRFLQYPHEYEYFDNLKKEKKKKSE